MDIKTPSLAEPFKNFIKLIYNKDTSQIYQWKAVDGLDHVLDEIIIPTASCKNSSAPIDIIQAILRKPSRIDSSKTIFEYDPEAIDLLKFDPTQVSFLMVHEWLWDITKNHNVNRKLNYFLHSEEFVNRSVDQVIEEFKRNGIVLDN